MSHHSDGDRAGGVVHVVDDPVITHPDPQPGPVSFNDLTPAGLGSVSRVRIAARMSFRAARSSWRKVLRARGRAWTAYSLIRSVPELGFEFVEQDRLAGLIPGGVSLGGVLGVLGGAERLDHRLRDDSATRSPAIVR